MTDSPNTEALIAELKRASDPFWYHTRDELIARAINDLLTLTAELAKATTERDEARQVNEDLERVTRDVFSRAIAAESELARMREAKS